MKKRQQLLELSDTAEIMSLRKEHQPLADRLRPKEWKYFCGSENIDAALLNILRLAKGRPPSMILWGPPGSGKTTLARLVGETYNAEFVEFSAVLAGVQDVRKIVIEARQRESLTILFIDEVHRFNKAQQDAFLPHIEDGTIVFIGATTENPSFALNNALLSRCRVVVLKALTDQTLNQIIKRAESETSLALSEEARSLLISFADGDARRMLNLFEYLVQSYSFKEKKEIQLEDLKQAIGEQEGALQYDRSGEEHYNLASAFIKSLRGSDPDAALYWGFRMLEAGEDPRFLFRRLIIFASEDISNADPRALQLAVSAAEAFERIGMPEGKIPLAQCITYLASVPKSNRSYKAMHKVIEAIEKYPRQPVPMHLRNAPTGLMKNLGYGAEYKYPHDFQGAHVQGVNYLPDKLVGTRFYDPSEEGLEAKIKQRLEKLKSTK